MERLNKLLNLENNSKYYLAFIILIAILLRLNGIEMALPYFHSDGGDVVPRAYDIVKTHNFDYKIYKYGGFYFYFSSLYFLIIFILKWILCGFSIPLNEIINSYSYHNDTTLSLFYYSKYLSLLFGIATILITYLIARDMFNKKVALLSSFLLTIHPLHIFESQLSNVDISLLLWIMLSFYFSFKILDSSKIKYYILSSIFVGLSMSTKYYFFAIIPLICTHIISKRNKRTLNIINILDYKILLSVYLIIFVFIATSPYFIINFYEVIKKPLQLVLGFSLIPRFDEGLLSKLMMGLVYQVIFSFVILNAPIIVLCIIEMKDIFKYKYNIFILLLLSVFIYLILFILFIKHPGPQYLMPILPFIIIIASFIVCNEYHNKYLYKIKLILLLLGIIYSFSDLIMPHYRSIENTQLELGKWIDNKISNNKSVYLSKLMFVPTIKLLYNHNFIYYPVYENKYYNYLGGINEKKEDLDTLNSGLIILVNPDYLVIHDAKYLHTFPISMNYKTEIYFKIIKELNMGKYKYRLDDIILLNKYYSKIIKYIMPLIDEYKFDIYSKINKYSIEDKINYIENIYKNDILFKKEIKYIELYNNDLKESEKEIIKNKINEINNK